MIPRAYLLVGALIFSNASGCDSKRKPEAETEKTLRGAELQRRKAYASDAMSSGTSIASGAQEVNLCASLGDGSIGPTPPIRVDCNAAKDGRCAPVEHPEHPWEYSSKLWDDDVWTAIGYSRSEPHRYHNAIVWKTLENGECEVRARIFGDIDDDSVYSTYEVAGTLPGPPEWNGEKTHSVFPLE